MTDRSVDGRAPSPSAQRRAAGPAVVGLTVALVLPLLAVAGLPFLPGVSPDAEAAIGMAVLWLLAGVVVALALRFERSGWAGIGLRRVTARQVGVAVLAGVIFMLLVPLLSVVAALVLPTTGGSIGGAGDRTWVLVLAAVITAAVTEEVLFRAYPVERLAAVTGSPWPGAVLGLIAFTVLHAGSWSPAHVVGVVLPLGALLALLYVWRRNLVVVMIAHLVTDLPLVVLAVTT